MNSSADKVLAIIRKRIFLDFIRPAIGNPLQLEP